MTGVTFEAEALPTGMVRLTLGDDTGESLEYVLTRETVPKIAEALMAAYDEAKGD